LLGKAALPDDLAWVGLDRLARHAAELGADGRM
jgi:hypothetical protein